MKHHHLVTLQLNPGEPVLLRVLFGGGKQQIRTVPQPTT